MPRIDTIQSQNRLQVTSPVPIASSGAARLTGENIEAFGDRVARAGVTIAQFQKDSELADRKAKLDNYNEQMRALSYGAFVKASSESKKLDGSDMLEIYDKHMNEGGQAILNTIEDSTLRGEAATALLRARNSQADNVANASIRTRIESIKTVREQAYGQRVGNVTTNPYAVMQAITENNASIDSTMAAYTPGEAQARKIEESKTIGIAAIQGLIDNEGLGPKRFEDARKMISGELAPILGKDAIQLGNVVQQQEREWTDRTLRNADKKEKTQAQMTAQLRESAIANILTRTAQDQTPDNQQRLGAEISTLVGQGILSKDDATAFSARPAIADATLRERTKGNYIKQISEGVGLDSVNSRILRDTQVSGTLSPQDAAELVRMAEVMKAAPKHTDPLQSQKLSVAKNMIKAANGGIEGQLGELIVPGANVQISTSMMSEMLNLTGSGEDPIQAAQKVIDKRYDRVKTQGLLPPKYVPISLQGDFATFSTKGKALVNKRIQELEKLGDKASIDEAAKLGQAYLERSRALQSIEERKKR